jgi:hypothetical protein
MAVVKLAKKCVVAIAKFGGTLDLSIPGTTWRNREQMNFYPRPFHVALFLFTVVRYKLVTSHAGYHIGILN